ncbi:MAG: HEAT repeat domain-containing protein [Planctomycetota bacterium]
MHPLRLILPLLLAVAGCALDKDKIETEEGRLEEERRKLAEDRLKFIAEREKAVQHHIADLTDKDADVRECAARMLGRLGAGRAVPDLIDVLRPERNEPWIVRAAAWGALVRITGETFGYENHAAWLKFWQENKDQVPKWEQKCALMKELICR